jgi:hypothetical protein
VRGTDASVADRRFRTGKVDGREAAGKGRRHGSDVGSTNRKKGRKEERKEEKYESEERPNDPFAETDASIFPTTPLRLK